MLTWSSFYPATYGSLSRLRNVSVFSSWITLVKEVSKMKELSLIAGLWLKNLGCII